MTPHKKLKFLGFDPETNKYLTDLLDENRLKEEHLLFAETMLDILNSTFIMPKHTIISPYRNPDLLDIRGIFIFSLSLSDMSFSQIGSFLMSVRKDWALDHSTISTLLHQFQKRIDTDEKFKGDVLNICEQKVIPLIKKLDLEKNSVRSLSPIPFDIVTNTYSRDLKILLKISVKEAEAAEKMLAIISKMTKLKPKDIICASQIGCLVEARRIYIVFIRKILKLSLSSTGRFLKSRESDSVGKDSSTIVSTMKRHDNLVSSNDKKYVHVFNEAIALFEGISILLSKTDFQEYFFNVEEVKNIALLNNIENPLEIENNDWFTYDEMILLFRKYKIIDPVITSNMMRNSQFFTEKRKRELIPVLAT